MVLPLSVTGILKNIFTLEMTQVVINITILNSSSIKKRWFTEQNLDVKRFLKISSKSNHCSNISKIVISSIAIIVLSTLSEIPIQRLILSGLHLIYKKICLGVLLARTS